jgi:two-component system OmpR family response regulator
MATILIADDERHIRDVVRYALEREGLTVEEAPDGRQALDRVRRGGVDLLVLDVLMPELDGLGVCRKLRDGDARRLPIIFLSSRGEEIDRILGLELGGDDYLAKPFSPRELATRVKAVLRRAAGPPDDAPVLVHGAVRVDVAAHEVTVAGARVELTATELALLRALLERPGRVLTRAQLIQRAYVHDNHITWRTIDTHVRRIRAKMRGLGADPIETVHGVGYKAAHS